MVTLIIWHRQVAKWVKAIVDAWSGRSDLQHIPHPKNSVYSSPGVQSVSLCSLPADSPYSSTSRLSFSTIFIIPFLCQAKAQNGSQPCKNRSQTPKYAFQAIMQSIHNHLSNIIVMNDTISWTNLSPIIAHVFTLPPFFCLHSFHFSYHSFFPSCLSHELLFFGLFLPFAIIPSS